MLPRFKPFCLHFEIADQIASFQHISLSCANTKSFVPLVQRSFLEPLGPHFQDEAKAQFSKEESDVVV
jgi:hypothetical protein